MPRSSFFDGDPGDPVDPPALAPEPVGDGSSIPSSFYERNLAQDAAAETECEANAAAAANSATAAANSSTSAAASAGSAASNATAAGVSSAGASAAATAAAGSASNASTSAGASAASASGAATSATNAVSSASAASASAAAAAATGVEVDADEAAAAASAAAAAASAAAAAAIMTDGDKGDVIVSGGGTVWELDANVVDTAELVASSVTNAKLANMVASTIKGRISTTGAPQDLTATQATALLNLFDATHQGLAPSSGGGTTNFLRADATWAAPPGGGGGGGGGYPHSVLLANTTYYIRTTGNDTTGNGSLGNPWLTIQHAMIALDGFDFGGFFVVIDVGPGTFGGWGYRNFWGSGQLVVRGAGSAFTTITDGPNDGAYNFGETITQNAGGSGDVILSISQMTCGGTGYAHVAIFTVCGSFALWDVVSGAGDLVFDLTGGQVFGLWCDVNHPVVISVYVGSITFKGGNAQYGLLLEGQAFFTSVTGAAAGFVFTGTPNFTTAFIHCDVQSAVDVGSNACPISGAYTGNLYELLPGCYIAVNGSPGWTYNGTAAGGVTVALSATDSEASFDKLLATGHSFFGNNTATAQADWTIASANNFFGDYSGLAPETFNAFATLKHTGAGAVFRFAGMDAKITIDPGSTGDIQGAGGLVFFGINDRSTSTITGGLFGVGAGFDHAGLGTVPVMAGVDVQIQSYDNGAGNPGIITNAYGVRAKAAFYNGVGAMANISTYYAIAPDGGLTNTNTYGFYIEDHSGIGTSASYNIFSRGASSRNVLEGVIELGHVSDTTLSRSSAGVLAVEGITVALNSTSAVHTAGTIELGAASDTTLARSGAGAITVEGVQVLLSGAALGTPASGTLTNCTGLPVAGITPSTVTALGVGTLELGNASDTTLSRFSAGVLAIEGTAVAMNSSTATHMAGLREFGITTNASPVNGDTWYDGTHLNFQTALQTKDLLSDEGLVEVLTKVLVEQRVQNLLLAEGLKIPDSLHTLRNDLRADL